MSDKPLPSRRWEKLHGERHGVLTRARQCSELTIPSLLPPEGLDENSELTQPYQSLGARGVNNLASKLLITLFPATASFFRFAVDTDVEDQVEDKTGLDDALRRRENKVMKWIERSALRPVMFFALKLLITTGNALVYLPKDGRHRTYRLDQYVVNRDPNGRILEIYIREEVDPATLAPDIVEACDVVTTPVPGDSKGKALALYTAVVLRPDDRMVDYWQEINDKEVPGSRSSAREDESPFLALRWSAVSGESYGRGHVEEYIGDLRSLEGLSMAIVGFSAVAAKIVFLVHPNSSTRPEDLTAAHTGDFVTGALSDIEALQLDKYADFKVANEVLRDLVIRISHAFLLTTGTVRDAERVTAEEIRMQAQELEDVLGGVYTIQSQELQLPLVRRAISVMEANGDLQRLPPDSGLEPTIVTGFDALGRGHELNRIRAFFMDVAQTFGPQVLQQYVKVGDGLRKFAVAHNVDIETLIKSDEEVQQAQQAAQQQALMAETITRAAGPVAGQAVKGMADSMNQGAG